MCSNSSNYILDVEEIQLKLCSLGIPKGAQGAQGAKGDPGSGSSGDLTSITENIGCTGNDNSQKNVILEPSTIKDVTQNIVIRTFGIGSTYGNFIRDDLLTDPKGDKRGIGAIDLSVKREKCSQVASGDFSVIGGGSENTTSAPYSVISGGLNNSIITVFGSEGITGVNLGGTGNFIGGGKGNVIKIISGETGPDPSFPDSYNSIVGGKENFISSRFSDNYADYKSECSFIGGGSNNRIIPARFSVITGGINNSIDDNEDFSDIRASFIGGGEGNRNYGSYYAVICGGQGNTGEYSQGMVIGGGISNVIQSSGSSFIGGGQNQNILFSGESAILGGSTNTIRNSSLSSINGGQYNTMSFSSLSFIGGGQYNTMSYNNSYPNGYNNFIGGGYFNDISDNHRFGVICGGSNNKIIDLSPSFINLEYSTIGGGGNNVTCSKASVIAGGLSNSILAPREDRDQSAFNTIGGGSNNRMIKQNVAIDGFNTICGGGNNQISSSGNGITIGGGTDNLSGNVSSPYLTIAGGQSNSVNNVNTSYSVISGGYSNTIGSGFTNPFNGFVIAGGIGNTGSGPFGVISGGTQNVIDYVNNSIECPNNVISGGSNNSLIATDSCVISGGSQNNIRNIGFGFPIGSAIGGGRSNSIQTRNYSFMAGLGLLLDGTDINSSTAFGQYNKNGSTTTTGGYGFTGSGALTTIQTTSNRIFMVGNGTAVGSRSNAFSVLNNGYALAQTGFITAGANADFAEYMESRYQVDGSASKILFGVSVVLDDQGFIMPSDTLGLESKVPIGVISGTAVLTSNTALEEWNDKYLKEKGVIIYEEKELEEEVLLYEYVEHDVSNSIIKKRAVYKTYEIVDSSGNVVGIEKIHQKVKVPIYDKEIIYIDVSEVIVNKIIDEEQSKIRYVDEVITKKVQKMETIQIIDESGNVLETNQQPKTINKGIKKEWKPKLNPDYDPNQEYKSRPERPEWNLVGLVGQVYINKNQRTNPNWIKIKDIDIHTELWLIK